MIVTKIFVFEKTPASPCILLQVTELVESYIIWVGISDTPVTSSEPQDILEQRISQGCLATDWGCGVPPLKDGTFSISTPLFRSSSNDNSLSMSLRLARRFKKQIFLSIDATFSLGNPVNHSHILLQIERNLISALKSLETHAI
ncbi:uncharacterized protein EI90DRAFT_3058588 [Cantharellus anzutake]|uniref:uncharacterized protein n=1 Tax=Cantharellus anzutake TaxID=1750568 RepID=UPI001905D507|nr:uncharacterized protein EI90DRAFT_3058588 [Cantharellus anzutake]KAF8331110.1 hypothetical protein EI90DRAFT_3058588 [Cantharellus anzutake]